MAVKIISQPGNFLLIGASRGFLLTVNCSEQLTRYNTKPELLEIDLSLASFSTASDVDSLRVLIDLLVRSYGLQRRRVFRGDQFAPILVKHLGQIRNLPPARIESIGDICEEFEKLRKDFSQALERRDPLPDVSLSKLLHFTHPASFWILDSRVNMVLDIWGYPTSYAGFGNLLKDLFRDHEFKRFRAFLEQRNRQLLGNHPLSDVPCSFLKLLDKVLWFTGDKQVVGE